MRSLAKRSSIFMVLCLVLSLTFGMTAFATSDDDNSLSGLGIQTEGAVVTPEFAYGVVEYDVVVPAGTQSLALDPVTTNPNATITDISGTELAEDGTATVVITVTAPNGDPYPYTLHVTREAGAAPETESETEKPTEVQTEPQTEAPTEDSRYVKVDKNTIQEAENTISVLKDEISGYRETVTLYTRIMYGLIALSVILLFMVINLMLKRKDLKEELNGYRSLGYTPSGKKAPRNQKAAPAREPRREKGNAERAKAPARDISRMPEERPQSGAKNRNMPRYEEDAARSEARARAMARQDAQERQQRDRQAREALKEEQRQIKAQVRQEKNQRKAQEKDLDAQVKAMVQGSEKKSQPVKNASEKPQAKKSAPEKKDVEIDMIDL